MIQVQDPSVDLGIKCIHHFNSRSLTKPLESMGCSKWGSHRLLSSRPTTLLCFSMEAPSFGRMQVPKTDTYFVFHRLCPDPQHPKQLPFFTSDNRVSTSLDANYLTSSILNSLLLLVHNSIFSFRLLYLLP